MTNDEILKKKSCSIQTSNPNNLNYNNIILNDRELFYNNKLQSNKKNIEVKIDNNIYTNKIQIDYRDNILPIWDDTANRNGGSWSIKLNDISSVFNVWLKLSIMMAGENIVKDEKHKLSKLVVGLSINLRNQNTCIIKIWNRDATLNSIKLLNDDITKEFGYNIIYKKNMVEY